MKPSWIGNVKRIVLPYLLVSAVWILSSDWLAALLLPERSQLTQVQTIKGLLFVALSGSLIAWLLRREGRRQEYYIDELVESQRRYRQAMLNSPNPIFSIDPEGTIKSCNTACLALFGFQQGMVGLHYESVLATPKMVRQATEYVRRVIDDGVTLTGVDLLFRTRDGSTRMMVSRLYPIMGPDGKVEECVFANSDVTSRRRAEERLRFQAKLLDNVREAVVAIDLQGLIIYWGGGAETLYGYRAEETLGLHLFDIFQEGFGKPLADEDPEFHDQGLWSGQLEQRDKDGVVFWADVTLAKVSGDDDEVTGFIGIARDISRRHRAELQTRQRNRELTLLNRVISGANSGLNPNEVLVLACRELVQTFNVSRAIAALVSPDGQEFRFAAEYADEETITGLDTSLRIGKARSLRLLMETRQPLIVEDARNDPRLADVQAIVEARHMQSVLIVPLLLRDEVLGVLALSTDNPHAFTPGEAELAMSVGGAVAQALHNTRLYSELQDSNVRLIETVASRTTELQQVKNRVEAILENSPDVILLLSPPDRIETANRAFGDLFRHAGDPYGMSLLDRIETSDQHRLKKALKDVIERGTVARLEVTVCRFDQSQFEAEVALAAVSGQQKPMVVATVRDISALKEVERLKDDFVSNVSHELRTPIASLKVYHELLRHDTDKREIYMERLQREIDRLAGIIESLLTLSRIDQGRLQLRFQPVNVSDLLAEYAADRWPLADSNELSLVLEKGPALPAVRADRVLLGQVISILLTNAFNYTPAGGSVRVMPLLRKGDGEQRWVGFSVADTGPGIPDDEIPSLFTRFFRGKAGIESGMPGTGLGLAIASEIVQAHDGHIEAASSGQPGEGACFTVWLPVKDPPAEA